MAELLKWAHATVTTCHSRTRGVRLVLEVRNNCEKKVTQKILVSKSQVFQIGIFE